MNKLLLISGCFILFACGCEKIFTPEPENLKTVEQMYTDPAYAQGFLVNAYRSIPTYYDDCDYATDDAVTNQKSNAYLKLASGAWTATNNPTNLWQSAYGAIQYLNLFLQNSPKVHWADDTAADQLFTIRMRGEAFGLRALFMYYLLRNHAGFGGDGTLLGVPIITEFQTVNSDFNVPRATFAECLKQVYKDLDSADVDLPFDYEDVSSAALIPERFSKITQTPEVYNRVMGHYSRQLYNGLIAKSIRTRMALLAASPAFQSPNNPGTWADAANAAATVIDYKGGVSALPAKGATYYTNTAEIGNLSEGINPPEIIWRENLSTNNSDEESNNYPPSLFGKGYMNPTQNLVDAFPMNNGYPITNSASGYDPKYPYKNRDPRLALYIIYNGSSEGVNASTIYTGSASGTDDGINIKETSTRTGYYMKKRLNMSVNCNPASVTGQTHYKPRIRYTEIYLDYAEAANEAWGPTGTGSHSYSAYDIIKAIRGRAGLNSGGSDPYLESCMESKEKMRDLIHNERRLELCFEGFRFWDLRRWKSNLNTIATGLDVNGDVIKNIDVESRNFTDYMYYGPIPYSEILKYPNLQQNKGWK